MHAEGVLRALALGLVGVALWQRLAPAPPAVAPAVARADEAGLGAALARWTAAPTPAADVRLDTLPDPAARAWLAALATAGTRITWRAAGAPALAAATEAAADPAGGVRVLAAAPAGALVTAADAVGLLDSARSGAGGRGGGSAASPAPGPGAAGNVSADAGTILQAPAAAGMLRVTTPGATARLRAPAAPRLGAVLVVGRAGWEGRFTAAALEERGWTVRTRFALAPGVVIGDAPRPIRSAGAAAGPAAGSPEAVRSAEPAGAAPPAAAPLALGRLPAPRLDTATFAAVVAVDSTAAPLAAALARYVRTGGGLVLAGDAARAPSLAALAPAAPAPVEDDSTGAVAPLVRLRGDAVPLAWRRVNGRRTLVAAARRLGAGRVVQIADVESWRRRLRADDAAPAAHRAWWAQALAAAAYAPPPPDSALPPPAADPPPDPAPLAATVAALGPVGDPPAPGAAPDRRSAPRRLPDALLIGGALAALLAEVASRRLRGAA